MRARKTRCIDCPRIVVPYRKGRCETCWNAHERKRDSGRQRDRPWYRGEWRRVSRQAIKDHVKRYGYRCPHCDSAHPERNPLTADHVVPRSLEGGVRVLCRSCNSSKGQAQDSKTLRRHRR